MNHAKVSLNDNKIEITLYLEDKQNTNINKLIQIYNSKCTQKNRIVKYELSNEKNMKK